MSFPNRFDTDYLIELKKHLSIAYLRETALKKPKIINGKEYLKCINIDFCGLAGTTLFFSNPEDKNITPFNLQLRREISEAFHYLLKKETLKELNEDNIDGPFYIRIRFCFSYLFSEYPVCLIKAEDNELWNNQGSKPIDSFYLNRPIKKNEFDASHTHLHQQNSLKQIIKILKENKDLVFLDENGKMENTIQLRFNVIPSPACCLLINETAFSDPYLYAKNNDQLFLNYPVSILEKEKDRNAFKAIQDHFYYLWRHDLTLFCKDATNYLHDNLDIDGLITVHPPDVISGPEGTGWKHKIDRIWERMRGKDANKTEKDISTIEEWKTNVKSKFLICTRQLQAGNNNDGNISIKVCMKKDFYYFNIKIPVRNIEFEYLQAEPNLLYAVLVHYSYAIWHPIEPVMHKHYSHGLKKMISELKKQLNNADLDKKDSGTKYFDEIFTSADDKLILNAGARDIVFEYNEKMKTVTYSASTSKHSIDGKANCLDYFK